MESKIKTAQILATMHILAWVACIGMSILAGAILVSFGISWINPEFTANLYRGRDLLALRDFGPVHYTIAAVLMIAVPVLKAQAMRLIIKILSGMNLTTPFTIEVTRKIQHISYLMLAVWVVSIFDMVHRDWILGGTGSIRGGSPAGEFLFIAGLVFIISQIFKRGVELQSDNDLTV